MFHVIDDEEMLCGPFVKILQSAGFEAAGFVNPLDYLAYVKSDGYVEPTAIFTDIQMPQMSGFELIDKLRESMPNMKIVIVSGFFENQKQSQKRACHYLPKPISPLTLIEIAKALATCSEDLPTNNPEHQPLANQRDWQCPLDCFDCEKNSK